MRFNAWYDLLKMVINLRRILFMTDTRYLYEYFLEKSQTDTKRPEPQKVKKPKKSKGGKKS